MGRLNIESATAGLDQNNLVDLANSIINLINETNTSVKSDSLNVLSTIDTVWVGASANMFKEKLSYDTDTITQVLREIAELVKGEINNAGSNVEEYDSAIAASLFGASYSPQSSGGNTDFSFASDRASFAEYKGNQERVINNIVGTAEKVGEVLGRTGATIGTAACGLVEGIESFGEAILDFGAILGTGVASIGTGIYDGCNAIACKITGNKYESATVKMWEGTKAFVATDFTTRMFDSFYNNTAVGQTLKNNAYGFDVTRNISKGVGYTAGVVALSIATAGAGGAVIGGGTTLSTAGMSAVQTSAAITTHMAGIGAAAGMGRGSAEAWQNGASTLSGLAYGGATGAWEGLQFYAGGKIAGMNPFAGRGANAMARVGLDTLDSAAEGVAQPALQSLYNGKSFQENFEEAGGVGNIAMQGAIGGIMSTGGEGFDALRNLQKSLRPDIKFAATPEVESKGFFEDLFNKKETKKQSATFSSTAAPVDYAGDFFKMNSGNGSFGADQGFFYNEYYYSVNGTKVGERAMADYVRTGAVSLNDPNVKKYGTMEYLRLKNKLKGQGYTGAQASAIMRGLDRDGACSYAAVVNGIFNEYRGAPEAFKNTFGFDMLRYDEKTGASKLNSGELLLDLYTFANDERNGGTLFSNTGTPGGPRSVQMDPNVTDVFGRATLRSDNQQYASGTGGMNTDLLNRYIKSKDPSASFYTKEIVNNPPGQRLNANQMQQVINTTNNYANSNYQLNLGIAQRGQETPIRMISTNPNQYGNVSTLTWNEGKAGSDISGHAVHVTGASKDGFIVSSWGKEYMVPYSDLMDGWFRIDAFAVVK